jgi:hypothetical protein
MSNWLSVFQAIVGIFHKELGYMYLTEIMVAVLNVVVTTIIY